MRIYEILKEAEYNAPYADSKDYQPMTPEEWSALMYIKPKYDPEKRGVLLPDNVWKIQVKRPEWIPPDKWLDWVKQSQLNQYIITSLKFIHIWMLRWRY